MCPHAKKDRKLAISAPTQPQMPGTDRSTGQRLTDHPLANVLSQRSSAGFTLIEVIMVLLLLSIVATVGIPALNSGLDEARLSGTADEIVTALEFAQMSAMISGCQTRVTIDDGADTVLVEQFKTSQNLLGSESRLDASDVDGGAFAPMGNPMNRGTEYSFDLTSENRFGGTDITVVAFGAGNWVVFDALGTPSSGGTVTLVLGSRQVVLTLNPLAGKVTLSDA